MGKQKYAFVIGGTGMLKKVTLFLAENNYNVSVIGRNAANHQELLEASNNPENIHPIIVDYHNRKQLNTKLKNALHTYGCPSLVISWIHSTAPKALPFIIEEINRQYSSFPWRLYHIQSSSRFLLKENTPVPENCQYRRVYLGFVIENNQSRWLTHEEIATGVIKAIKTDNEETIVGTVEPWDRRP